MNLIFIQVRAFDDMRSREPSPLKFKSQVCRFGYCGEKNRADFGHSLQLRSIGKVMEKADVSREPERSLSI